MNENLEYLLREYGPTMTMTQVAQALKVTPKTIYARRDAHGGDFEIPSYTIGRRRLFNTQDVANYLAKNQER